MNIFQQRYYCCCFYYYYYYYYYYYCYFRSCIGFFGNRSGGPRTGHRARPQVADRGALSRTMYQAWCRRNNPQAKVLTTMPRAAWHQGVVSHTVSLGNQATSWSIEALPLHAGLCRGGPNTSLATRGTNHGAFKFKQNDV